MSEDRGSMVLRAIVQDYVQTSEPVGCGAGRAAPARRLAATVRNDMAALEEEGDPRPPHVGGPCAHGRGVPALRRPPQRGQAAQPASAGDRQFLEGAVDLDDVVDRTVRLIASLTRQVAVVQYPSLPRSTLRHIELVPVGATHLMVVLIVNTGRVEQRASKVASRSTESEALVA